MASNHEFLLSSPSPKKSKLPCKALLVTLSIASVICLTSLITIHFTTNSDIPSLQPSDLCTHSPNPSTCHAIVSNALTPNLKPTPLHVFNSVITKSLHQLNSATDELHRQIHDHSNNHLPLVDCIHLMDLSRDRLIASATAATNGAHTDARTWLSAVLTNHATCLDGLGGQAPSALESQLQVLMDSASASLAILNAVTPSSSSRRHDDAVKSVIDFPSWLSFRDRKLLEATPLIGIVANAVVAQDGSGSFTTVQAAVTAAPNAGTSRYVIYVKKGFYKENVNIPKTKTNLMIVGDGMAATIISGSLNVIDGSTTFNSATLAAAGDGLILQDLRIENTAGAVKHQAVALRVSADLCVINRCNLAGYQDTLYTQSLRQFYRDSTISGTVDFIFGDAAVVFQNCSIVASKPLPGQQNTVTAQGRIDPNENTGTSIQNCQVIPGSDLVPVEGSVQSYLGRPWKMYSRTVVMQSFIGGFINPQGWLPWDGTFALSTLFYGEYQNRGPGAGTAGRVNWAGYNVITDPKVANTFTVAALIQGGSWLSSTGVAFTEGL